MTTILIRRQPAVIVLAAAALLTAGCATGSPGATEAPETPSTSTAPTASETTPATTEPAPTSAEPSAEAYEYCGDEIVIREGSIVGWPGTTEEQLEQAAPEGTFSPESAIAGLDVICVVTYRMPIDGSPGVAVISEALVERSDAAIAHLETWVEAEGYTVTDADGWGEHRQPADADGYTPRKIFWAPLTGDGTPFGEGDRYMEATGAPADALIVWHAEFVSE